MIQLPRMQRRSAEGVEGRFGRRHDHWSTRLSGHTENWKIFRFFVCCLTRATPREESEGLVPWTLSSHALTIFRVRDDFGRSPPRSRSTCEDFVLKSQIAALDWWEPRERKSPKCQSPETKLEACVQDRAPTGGSASRLSFPFVYVTRSLYGSGDCTGRVIHVYCDGAG